MKYIRAFFTFIGYCTTVAAIGGGIFWYIGHRKAMQKTESTVTLQEISMTPAKEPQLEPVTFQAVPEPPQVYPRKSAPVAVRKAPATTEKKPAKVSAPVTYAAPKAARKIVVEKAKPDVKQTRTTPRKKSAAPPPVQEQLPPCTLSYKATDTSNPRTGRGIVNVHAEPSELEKQAIRDVQMEQLKEAAEQIRHPKGWESGLLKFISGNK